MAADILTEIRAIKSAQAINQIIMPRDPWWRQPAIYLAIVAVLLAFQAEREARLGEYYAVDVELCLLKKVCPNPNGVPVPADPWGLVFPKNGGK